MPRTANNAPTSRKCSRSDHDKFVIRMPKGLRCAIAEVSRTNNRSMNSELVNRISQSLTSALADPGMASPAIQESDVIVSQVNTALAMRNKYLEDLLKTMPTDIRSQEMATWHATISTSIF